ncbi:hypothetical protein M438DRAFT_364598 [Aureobasidium pullulans EXF-150]|uniref:Uncharacterized protein n=2 Tax=Aureobasidium pullulans TaxID=5580 RepID=A0A074XJ19_AURPU|nr:uncharacterized protein M438DRAFT_364598 [Aureobasidium pullulans EXF-150]KEQ85518.1 hypothetical protein M438DRAFT_364598 [Aureobasidium pullulans EXF-150]THW49652.1 hypothetical protein D6D21_02335 [Aureobasidium pullulans]
MSANDIAELEASSDCTPIFLFRAYTLDGMKHTNGLTTPRLYAPSAAFIPDLKHRAGNMDFLQMRRSIYDIPQEELRPMLGDHLLWKDRIQDELLSHTSSCLFGIVHLLLRHLKGQGEGYLAIINRTRAFRLERWYKQQPENAKEPGLVRFHYGPRLCDKIDIFNHNWVCQMSVPGLHYRKFTHEYITQGLFGYPEDDVLQHASWADLVSAGIFELLPDLKVQCRERPSGLYTTLRGLRSSNFERTRASKITENEMEAAEKLAWLHTLSSAEEKEEGDRPQLWALLNYLTFRKREAGDELFQDRIRQLGYTRSDFDEGLHAGFEVLPSNLPELHSLYHLAADVQSVVGGQPLNPLVLVRTFAQNPRSQALMLRNDADYEALCTPTLTSSSEGYEIKQRCGLTCDCYIWGKIRKRKHAPIGGTVDQEDNDDNVDQDSVDALEKTGDGDLKEGLGGLDHDLKRQKTAPTLSIIDSVSESEVDFRRYKSTTIANDGEDSSNLISSRSL